MSAIPYLDERTRELVGLGAAVASNCLPCVRFHLSQASKAGCSPEEISEAAEIAEMVKKRPSADMTRLVADLVARERERVTPGNESMEEKSRDANL